MLLKSFRCALVIACSSLSVAAQELTVDQIIAKNIAAKGGMEKIKLSQALFNLCAVITYYQKKRHIFGDLKFEIYDPQGNLISTIPGSKRRGLNRIEWSMRLKAPKVPPPPG
jgi:hypothetical protein